MILNIVQMLLAQPILLFTVTTVFLIILARLNLLVRAPAGNVLPTFAIAALGAAIAVHLGSAFAYLVSPLYFDHIEPNTAVVAYLFSQGLPVYHELEAATRYSMLYGPAHYIFNGLSYRLFGFSDFAFKLTGVICLLVSYLFIGLSVKRLQNSQTRDIAIAFGVFAILALFFRNYSFWSKSDSIMTAFVAMGVFSCFLRHPMKAAILCGICLGITVNGKLHGFAYFLPLIAFLIQRDGWRSLFVVGAVSFAVAFAPYIAFSNVSLLNYLALVQSAGAHGLSLMLFLQNASLGLFFVMPLLCVGVFALRTGSQGQWLRQNWLILIATAMGFLVTVTIGSKPGSGPYHLLPFLPIVAVLTVVALKQIQLLGSSFPALAGWFWTPFSAFVLVALAKGLYSAWFGIILVANFETPRLVINDIQEVIAANPDSNIHMGYGDGSRYSRTFFRTQLAFAGEPYLLDAAALMDFDFSGVPIPEATFAAMNEDPYSLWLIPRDQQPFTIRSWLERFDPEGYIFEKDFQQNFKDRFVLSESTEYFDVWVPRQLPDSSELEQPGSGRN